MGHWNKCTDDFGGRGRQVVPARDAKWIAVQPAVFPRSSSHPRSIRNDSIRLLPISAARCHSVFPSWSGVLTSQPSSNSPSTTSRLRAAPVTQRLQRLASIPPYEVNTGEGLVTDLQPWMTYPKGRAASLTDLSLPSMSTPKKCSVPSKLFTSAWTTTVRSVLE
jgi:hypothetical protein